MTRAKSLLIIIGDASNLCTHIEWGKIIKYCQDNESFVKAETQNDPPPSNEDDKNVDACVSGMDTLRISLEKAANSDNGNIVSDYEIVNSSDCDTPHT